MDARLEKPQWQHFNDSRKPGERPEHVATRILRAYGARKPPVDVEAIAKWLGLRVARRPNPGWDGAVDTIARPAVLWVNSNTVETRQRFTVAHELGHAVLHPIGRQYRDATFAPEGNRAELDANDFAASLLIPLWMLEPIVSDTRHSTAQLAALFKVSPGAMGIQLEKLL